MNAQNITTGTQNEAAAQLEHPGQGGGGASAVSPAANDPSRRSGNRQTTRGRGRGRGAGRTQRGGARRITDFFDPSQTRNTRVETVVPETTGTTRADGPNNTQAPGDGEAPGAANDHATYPLPAGAPPPPGTGRMRNMRELAKGKKRLRSNIHIASINMRGGGSAATLGKWRTIHQTMKRRRIGIMAVQETHLKDADLDRLNNTHKRTVHIINSNPTDKTNANGVAIILNKNLTAWAEHEKWVLCPGRALMVKIPWKKAGASKVVLAIYAPNAPNENAAFWKLLKKKWTDAPRDSPLPLPDVMLGDFNLVEDSADRLPSHSDNAQAVEALRDLKKYLKLIDGWRTENPDEMAYTYTQVTPSQAQSRIDRIYTTHKIYQTSRDWEIYQSAFLTDHKFVAFHYFDPGVQVHGNGRWTVPHYITKDSTFIKTARKIVAETVEKMKEKTPGAGSPPGRIR
ncbi:Endonuclease/exonuclease/phosphatase [Ephemerocybe angulata]|uniref:Endonuclease/exonuclease/phosphatase n=1 Tax=Ephemerocybe angulata TaxID=980116 RepID=A0A8H6HRF0_9AGAR|nr:Endonuclease/exonuclease/phosphatase [Tulosesus angulatus]